MAGRRTVKARSHHGAPSLDLTIPADVKRAHGINAGDLFLVTAETRNGSDVVLKYKRVYRNGE
jgi:hypothetical protein